MVTIALIAPGLCRAGEPAVERSARMLEHAAKQAGADRERVIPKANILDIQPVAVPIADPLAVASRYRDQLKPEIQSDELLVFISTGMPRETLDRLGRQVAAAGGVLVLRGFRGGLVQGAMEATLKDIKPLADMGARIEINPEAFSHFNISVVPTYVLAMRPVACEEGHCPWGGEKLVGDVSLDYALEHWVDEGGRVGTVAQRYLDRLGGTP